KNLGAREKEALILLLLKKSASEVAAEMVIANGTAKSHIRHLYKKLNVHSRDELFELFNIV
ncbi:MAG: LuxR C-terminal-related transcriptional regulator, partial [Raoultibacter sp.]